MKFHQAFFIVQSAITCEVLWWGR